MARHGYSSRGTSKRAAWAAVHSTFIPHSVRRGAAAERTARAARESSRGSTFLKIIVHLVVVVVVGVGVVLVLASEGRTLFGARRYLPARTRALHLLD